MTNFELISFANAAELAHAAANAWLNEIELAGRDGKNFCVALSGGRIAQNFFATTAGLAKAAKCFLLPRPFFLGGRALRAAGRSGKQLQTGE